MGGEGPVELEGVHPVDLVELGAPLHGARPQVPEPTAHVGQGLGVAQPALHLGQGGLGQVLLGDVPGDGQQSPRPVAPLRDGTEGHPHGEGQAVATDDLALEVDDPLTGQGP